MPFAFCTGNGDLFCICCFSFEIGETRKMGDTPLYTLYKASLPDLFSYNIISCKWVRKNLEFSLNIKIVIKKIVHTKNMSVFSFISFLPTVSTFLPLICWVSLSYVSRFSILFLFIWIFVVISVEIVRLQSEYHYSWRTFRSLRNLWRKSIMIAIAICIFLPNSDYV